MGKFGKKVALRTTFVSAVFLLILMTQTASGFSFNQTLFGFVWYATYDDLDGGGVPDDIYWNTTIVAIDLLWGGEDEKVKGVLVAALEYPSGETAWYLVFLKFTHLFTDLDFYFLNHATESGWYEAHLFTMSEETFKINRAYEGFWDSLALRVNDSYVQNSFLDKVHYSSLVFDPPGGVGGTPPMLMVFAADPDTKIKVDPL